jgi:hypothetical protein
MTFLQAISVSEGFPIQGSRSQRNNNPGDLIWCLEAQAFGATHGDVVNANGFDGYSGFAVFPDARTGWKALQRWLSVTARFDHEGNLVGGYLGGQLQQVITRFAPPIENNTKAYIEGVCERTGLNPTTPITADLLQTPEAV